MNCWTFFYIQDKNLTVVPLPFFWIQTTTHLHSYHVITHFNAGAEKNTYKVYMLSNAIRIKTTTGNNLAVKEFWHF